MNNYINYYYELYPNSVNKIDENYMFIINNEKYYLVLYKRAMEEIDTLVNLNREMINRNSLVHEIILNKEGKALILAENNYYALFRVYVNETKKVTLDDIIFMLNGNDGILPNNVLNRMNWDSLWETKIDYFEYQMGHHIKKYPFIYNTIDYYIGIGENAISYVKNIGNISSPISVCHKRIGVNSTLFDLYNPFNLIIDYKVRDISEYIKDAVFNNQDAYKLIDKVLRLYIFDNVTLKLLFARFLFPSYYFDLYDDILEKDLNENKIINILKKTSKYEDFLKYLLQTLPINQVEWINKKAINDIK